MTSKNNSSATSSPHDTEVGGGIVAFPTRPRKANFSNPVRLQTNSFRLVNLNPSIKDIQKYALKFEPEIPTNSKVQGLVLRTVRDKISEALKVNFIVNGILYSYTIVKDDLVYDTVYDE